MGSGVLNIRILLVKLTIIRRGVATAVLDQNDLEIELAVY